MKKEFIEIQTKCKRYNSYYKTDEGIRYMTCINACDLKSIRRCDLYGTLTFDWIDIILGKHLE